MSRYRIAIAGGGYRGLLDSDRTRIPGLVSIYDIEPTVRRSTTATPPLTSRDHPDPEGKLRELDARLTDAHDSPGPPRTSSSASARSSRCSRSSCARPSGVVPRCSSARSRSRPRSRSARWRIAEPPHGRARAARHRRLGAVAVAAVTPARLALPGGPAVALRRLPVVLAVSQETSSLAAFGPHPDGGVRFYGISNQVETLLLVPGSSAPRCSGRPSCRVVGAFVLVVVGASGLGADGGGGILVFGAGFLFLWLRLRGVALTARNSRSRRERRSRWARPRRPRRGARRLEPHQPHAR